MYPPKKVSAKEAFSQIADVENLSSINESIENLNAQGVKQSTIKEILR